MRARSLFNRMAGGLAVSNQKGLSLIEIMVVTAIIGIAAVSTGQLITNLLDGIRASEFRYEAAQKTQEVADFLANASTCEKNFKDLTFAVTPSEISKDTLIDKNSVLRYQIGNNGLTRMMFIETMILKEFTPADPTDLNNKYGMAKFELKYVPIGRMIGPHNLLRKLNVYTVLKSRDPASPDYMEVLTCSSQPIPQTGTLGVSASFNFTGGPGPFPTINDLNGISDVDRIGAGRYRVTFAQPMVNPNYVVMATLGNATSFNDCCLVSSSNQGNTSFVINVRSSGSNNNYTNVPLIIHGVVFPANP